MQQIHTRGEKESERNERKGLSASVFEVANANDLSGRESEFLCSCMQKDGFFIFFFNLTEPFRLLQTVYQTFNGAARLHRQDLEDVFGCFRAAARLYTCLLHKNKCQLLAKGCQLQDKRAFVSQARSKERHNKLNLPIFLSQFFFSCLPSRRGNDRGRLLGFIDS